MFNILTLNKISETGTSLLPKENYNVAMECKSPEGILLRSFDMHSMDMPESLLCIGRAGAGVNNIPVDKCTDKGIVVFNTPGANANAVKELIITSLLISSRKIPMGINWAQSLKGETGVAATVEKGKGAFVGPEIMGKTLGIIGLGAIGALVANACISLGMKIIGYDPFITEENSKSLSTEVKMVSSLDDLYKNSDYITIHVPLNKETKNMFNIDTFAKVKKGLRLLNFSRGELVDNDAVKLAIENGMVAAYVTDFPTEDLLGYENIITIPHLGASTPESEDNCAAMAATELKDYLEYGNIKNSVNFPNCVLTYTGKKRICIIHKNTENITQSITNTITREGIHISEILSQVKASYGYTIADIDSENTKNITSSLMSVEGIIKVRII